MSDIYIKPVSRKRRCGRYLGKSKLSMAQYIEAEKRSFRGESVYGVPVSTWPASWCYGVVLKNKRGRKLLSKHETLSEATDSAARFAQIYD